MQLDRLPHPANFASLLVIMLALATSGLAFANTLVNDPTTDLTARDTQSGTSTIVFGSTVLTTFNDSGSSVGANRYTGWSRSTDGGVTFTDRGALTSSPSDFGYPVLARNAATSTVYLATLAGNAGVQVSRSVDGGFSFLAPVNSIPGVINPSFDKHWLAVDNFAGGGNAYLMGIDTNLNQVMRFFRSTTDGTTWGPSGGVPMVSGIEANGAYVAVAPNHDVYAFWFESSGIQRIRVRRSTDLGVTFGTPVTVVTMNTTALNGNLGLGGFRTNAFPQAAVNPMNGNIYVVYPNNPAGADRADIFFVQSTDSGATWGPSLRVNDDGTTRDQWQPSLAVTPDGSRVFVGWYDRRLDAGNTMIDNFGVIGTVSGASVAFGANFRINDEAYPPVFGVDPALNGTFMGDWDNPAADNSFFYYSWGDNRDLSMAHPGNQANVRLAKIPVSGTTSVEPASVATVQPALTPRQNPFTGALELALDLEATSAVELAIYDVAGRRIAGDALGALGVGIHPLHWDGRDAKGRDAGSGTFLAVVRVDGRPLTRKVVRLN